ncbi:MAG: adenylyltransferase/cytidyltransferase family protein [Candidatus Pacebacteria bacterium]|nr:adenylyltransferase/cytidyltransferase family protein [Candidatus Paceibacterota bacterium]
MPKQITIKEILDNNTPLEKRFIKDLSQLEIIVKLLKESNYRIVLTQGVWDLLHIGHAAYLEKAKSYGDILIVGVESDALTKKRKGPSRPVVPEKERVGIVSHLRSVDILVMQNNLNDLDALRKVIKPDVYIMSKTTKDLNKSRIEQIKKYCKEVIALEPQATTSTTARVRTLMIEGAQKLTDEIKKLTDDFINRI